MSNGQSVRCARVIGRSASSGSSTGPRLHFGYRSPSGASQTVFAGGCGRRSSRWVEQRGSREAPGTACTSCTTETCNGRDDDCDGAVDETAMAEICNGVDDDCDGRVDENARPEVCGGGDDDCDGNIDEWVCGDDGDKGVDSSRPTGGYDAAAGGCACHAIDGRGAFGSSIVFLLVGLRLVRRRVT